MGGVSYRNQRVETKYAHIPPQLLQPLASLKAVSLKLATRGHTVGYLPGAGDSLAENLKQMGYSVKVLDGENLTPDQLGGLDAMVIGVRAFNVRSDIASQLPVLFAYVENGGTIIAQYNRPDGLKTNTLAPFALRLSGDRVTDENAAVTFLAPDHPMLNKPNKITSADFERLGAGARNLFSQPMGLTLHSDSRVRVAAERRTADRAIRQRLFRLYWACILSRTARRRARSFPFVCQFNFTRQ